MAQTELQIVNGTSDSVLVYLTVGVVSGPPPNVTIADIPFLTQVEGNPNQGWVEITGSGSESYTPPAGTTLIGNICFGGPPINCPTADFPTAVNLFEFSLDLTSGLETIDISCVAGVNSLISVAMTGGGTWNAGPTQPTVTSFFNAAPGQNTGLVGVYPISCDACTASQNPPVCPNPVPPEQPQSQSICNVQRAASASGGTVTATFTGFS